MSAPSLLRDKVVVVTGGAGLLGRAFCQAISDSGGVAVVADLKEGTSAKVNFQRVDINDAGSLEELLDGVKRRYGRIDALVNNAYPRNANYGRKLEEVTRADFCDNLALHLGGYFLASQKFIGFFRSQGHGNIINMGSVYGYLAPRFELYQGTPMTMPVEYAVIKAGVLQLTKYLASYLAGQNIRVNAISPGGIEDGQPASFQKAYREFCSSKGMLETRDVCGALLFLLSDLSAFMNGQNLVIDDGFSL
jgi:NAD(P)-dependent dehydrogenase (short-subunit alcohol dehydrogenase family)